MKDSKLSVGMFGDEVKLLHDQLRSHGFDIPASEVERGFFGPATRQAVQDHQRTHGLPATGTVDERTAAAMNAAVTVSLRSSLQPSSVNVPSTRPTMATRGSAASIALPVALATPVPGAAPPTLSAMPAGIPLPGTFIPRPDSPAATDTTPASTSVTGSLDEVFIVRGVVRLADGAPFSGALVVAVDRDLRGEEALGQATTNRDGHYEIRYHSNQFARAEKASADLVVRAMDAAGAILAASPILFNAPAEATIDLIVEHNAPGVLSEFERLLNELEPLLVNVTVPGLPAINVVDKLADLKSDEIDFLSDDTGIDRNQIAFLVASASLQKRASEQQFSIPVEAFYGLARKGLPADLAALGMRTQKERSEALEQALKENIIPAAVRNSLPLILDQLQLLTVGQALQTPTAEGRPTLSKVLSLVLPAPEQQAAFLTAYANHGDQPIEEFWKGLRARPEFKDHVDLLQLNLQLGVLTQNHAPLMQALTADHGVASTRDLVKLDAAAWTNLINTPQANGQVIGLPPGVDIAGDTAEEKTKNYVNTLVGLVQTAFPTDTVAQLITVTPAAAIHVDETIRQGVTRFFANSPDFDLRSTRVDSYATEHAAAAFNGIAPGDQVEVTSQVKRVQRLFQVSTGFETMAGLLRTGLHSAHAIANIPRGSFITQHKALLGGGDKAQEVYERASAINARNLHVWETIYEAQYEPQTLAYGRDAENVRDLLIKRFPNYNELFGAPELCDCRHCSSAYSPAAYLVDMLEFLKHCTPNSKGKTPRDVLLGDGGGGQIAGRRPDIAHIPLSCENTDTPLPYVDLVNEVLEFYVKNNKLDEHAAQDTGNASAEELRAAPQHTIPEAYDTLKQAVYPLTLPYNQPLEVARVYLNHLGTSLDELMRTFQSGTQPFDDDIACEALRISREERAVIVGVDPHALVDFFYDPAHRPAGLLAPELTKVREFLKQTGIEYVDLVELLKTRFINPNQGTSQGLRLETTASVPNPTDSSRPILISPCDLDHTTISNLDDPTLDRMHRFIRLWRKLGWTIAGIDSALTALGASDIDPAFLTKLAQIKQLQALLDVPNVHVLLSLWADIETRGDDALYKKLFLNRSAEQFDEAFKPRNDGSVLSDAAAKLADQASVIRSALRVSDSDFAVIRADARLLDPPLPNPPTVFLNLRNVSVLYRYAVLARALKLRIPDFIALKALCGINPFSAPDQTLRFVEILGKQRRSRFSIVQLDYLYRHRIEPLASVAPPRDTVLSIAQTLHDGLLRIDADNRIADDPKGDLTRLKLGTMFEPAIVDQVIRMIDGTATYSVALQSVPSTLQIPAALEHKISLDRPAKALRFAGAMTTAELASLRGLSLDQAIAALHRQPRDLINNALSGFLNPSQAVTTLLENSSLKQDGTPDSSLIADKFKFVLENLLPFVGERQSHILIKQTLGDTFKLGGEIIELLSERLLKSRPDATQPAINDALALRTTGLSAAIFNTADLTGPSVIRTDAALAFDGNAIGAAAIPVGAGSVRWTGLFLAPDNAAVTLHVRASSDVKLWLGEDVQPIIDVTLSQASTGAGSQPQALKAGQLYPLRLEVRNLQVPQGAQSAVAELRWSGASLAKEIVPSANLYPTAVVDVFVDAFTLLHKAALLTSTFNLTQREVAYMTAHAADFAGVDPGNVQRTAPFDLNALPMKPADFNPAHFNQWERLCDLTALRDSLPQGDVTLIDVFQAASQAIAQLATVTTTLIQATGWDAAVVDTLVGSVFRLSPNQLKDERTPRRLQVCVQLVRRIGASPQQLGTWASSTIDAAQAQAIKKEAQAKYDNESWLAIAKPLSDVLRESQKAALVTYLLPRLGLTDSNQLFEFFLIDVDMTSCMMTSRIKQAISSVQLFVQRCLLNLEQRTDPLELHLSVRPSQIDGDHWQWMKNYRLWEANRKIFLYAENWWDPGLREGKSPFFKELESELLRNDLTPATVEKAFTNYLTSLDQVSRLDLRSLFWEDVDPDNNKPIENLHVFARTFHKPYGHFYRRLIGYQGWTPWEKVDLDIDSDRLIPVVRNGGLLLFWLTPVNPTGLEAGEQSVPGLNIAWSQYDGQRWLPRKVLAGAPLDGLDGKLIGARIENIVFEASITQGEVSIDCETPMAVTGLGPHFAPLLKRSLRTIGIAGCQGPAVLNEHPFASIQYSTGFLVSVNANMSIAEVQLRGIGAETAVLKHLEPDPDLLFAHNAPYDFDEPFIYHDRRHTYLVTPELTITPVVQLGHEHAVDLRNLLSSSTRATSGSENLTGHVSSSTTGRLNWTSSANSQVANTTNTLLFALHEHPFACEFIKRLHRRGIAGLLATETQELREPDTRFGHFGEHRADPFVFAYQPTDVVDTPYPRGNVDFSADGAYSLYNWEIFFHIPILIAMRLSKDRRFDDARKWFHYVFDPTDDAADETSPHRYWKFLPFKAVASQRIEELLLALNTNDSELAAQVEAWRKHPFQPDLIARIRPVAYQKTVVMKYVDNLIVWGDDLFSQDTIESINQATELYIMAGNLLGDRPPRISKPGQTQPETYANLAASKLATFSNALVALESTFPAGNVSPSTETGESSGLLGLGRMLYFCTPQNDKLLGYWDTIADRLFKIRHCMNIEGVVRELPLFEPPIDPALLVQAAARGVDIGSVLRDLKTTLPHYRFAHMLQKALEICADLKALGGALLSVLEKFDAESLAALRASHETSLLRDVREVKVQQRLEAGTVTEGLRKTRAVTQGRFEYYDRIPKRIEKETEHLDRMDLANDRQTDASTVEILAQLAHVVPTMTFRPKIQIPPPKTSNEADPNRGPWLEWSFGGPQIGAALQAWARYLNHLVQDYTYEANRASVQGGFDRRDAEWALQRDLAQRELEQIDKQIVAATIRETIASKEIANLDQQIENARAIEDVLRSKYTNTELYSWMQGEISVVYFQCYQMAYDLAKKAEKAFRFERGLTTSNFIQFGYWDSLRKGLLAGEQLYLALKQMERAYLDQNKREYEITKHISLMLQDPMALISLKETGRCEVELPEMLFDSDYPGHYMRRVKSVSLTIPCVVGPYTSINCTLTLLSNKTRVKSVVGESYAEREDEDDRFVTNFAAMQSIATSHAQNDSGMFELNFRDERYLPFEGAGVITRWRIDMPKDTNAFDFDTLWDVVLHLKYTAREGGEILGNAARKAMEDVIADTKNTPLARLFSLKHEFPSEWYRFLTAATDKDDAATDVKKGDHFQKFAITNERFPFFARRGVKIGHVRAFAIPKTEPIAPFRLYLTPAGDAPDTNQNENNDAITLEADPKLNGLLHQQKSYLGNEKGVGDWSLKIAKADHSLLATALDDIWLLFEYGVV